MTERPRSNADPFETVTERDSASLLKPHLPLLVLTETPDRGPNVMTAAWWMLAGYDPFRYLLSVDHKTFTYELIEEHPEFVLAIPTTDLIDAVALCGLTSGREVDKVERLDLDLVPAQAVEVPLLLNALGNIECRVDASFEYGNHSYYFGEVAAAHAKPNALDGRILDMDALSSEILAYLGSDYVQPDDDSKSRFYVDMAGGSLETFPDEVVLGDLPSH